MSDGNPGRQLSFELDLDRRMALIQIKEEKALNSLREAVQSGDGTAAQLQQERAMILSDLRRITERLVATLNGTDCELTYLVGSLFLHDCYQVLVQGLDERMHYVTGLRLGNLLTLDRIVEFESF